MDEQLKVDVAVVKEQQKATQNLLSAVDERQRAMLTTVTRLEDSQKAIIDTVARIEAQLEQLSADNKATLKALTHQEERLNMLDTGIKWGGGILATLVTYTVAKILGLH